MLQVYSSSLWVVSREAATTQQGGMWHKKHPWMA